MSTTVVTFRADEATDRIARFVEHVPSARVDDLGVLDDIRRYRVDEATWKNYTRAVSPRPEPRLVVRMYRCGECKVVAIPGALASHQRSKGHTGRTEVRT